MMAAIGNYFSKRVSKLVPTHTPRELGNYYSKKSIQTRAHAHSKGAERPVATIIINIESYKQSTTYLCSIINTFIWLCYSGMKWISGKT
jgi:hypothetical protein